MSGGARRLLHCTVHCKPRRGATVSSRPPSSSAAHTPVLTTLFRHQASGTVSELASLTGAHVTRGGCRRFFIQAPTGPASHGGAIPAAAADVH
ncbi:hypothetical protein HPB50_016450 [Hyalomma asiaticum]|uniref:Uncharacterized protein n=1 Tax=Hyalomma asiaticum TaxID=266040 RepID=A0ACB7SP36_HYAAI|nr:hypothetical protein HPB50_016450 [Hyalomma asiaticum]